jgi:N-acetylglucosaminyldiphosphoundecaprenol N-acetyl-beta-D-mannosaminyltransferase
MSELIASTSILGVNISALNMPLAVETIERWIENREKHYVCICNVHSVMEAQRDSAYMEILNNAGLRTPDGMPLVWLSRHAGRDDVRRVCGPDLLPELVSRSAVTGHRHFFYGGVEGVAQDLATRLSARHPGLEVAGAITPAMQPVGAIESDALVETINKTAPDILWVGLGSPKQDVWAANHLSRLDVSVIIAVGAAFDFHTDRVRRAPAWMQRSGLEWAFRLSQDPKRLWQRYMLDNGQFLIRMLRSAAHQYDERCFG